ncbi:hypothetical protein AAT19DRAFT_8778 [Rhodotorula toruloides]|uniref:Uncharacterized protein n=1 Tax=Rhodotorula toruloides TaxID=5286 RepID=A0A2T0AIC0_RHOTO|nr:hypothetical protein AAT19DRAFT_8778 [Rhodotorula toruloides]
MVAAQELPLALSISFVFEEETGEGIFCSTFDQTGTRLITGGADKTIKIYSEQA